MSSIPREDLQGSRWQALPLAVQHALGMKTPFHEALSSLPEAEAPDMSELEAALARLDTALE